MICIADSLIACGANFYAIELTKVHWSREAIVRVLTLTLTYSGVWV